MKVQEIFGLQSMKKNKKLEKEVYDSQILIQFSYLGKELVLRKDEKQKMLDILKIYAKKSKKFWGVIFLYAGEVITENYYDSIFDEFARIIIKKLT